MFLNYYAITAFINFIVSAVFAILVISKNPRNPRNIGFFFFSALITVWNLFYFFWQNVTDNPASALFWCRALMLPVTFIPVAYFYFTLAMTESIQKRKKTLIFACIVSFIFFLSDLTPYFIEKVEPVAGIKYWPIASPISALYWVWFSVLVLYSFYLLIKKYKISTGIQKLQLKYLIAGLIIAFIAGYFDIMPWFRIPIPPLPHILVSAYIFLSGYAITRYRLMDIKVVFRNILFYFGVALALYTIFYLIAFTHIFFFGGIFTTGGYLFGLFLAPVLGIILYVGNGILSEFLNKHVFSYLYNYQQAIKQASQKLSRYANLKEIADITITTIKNTLQAEGVALMVAGNSEGSSKFFEAVEAAGFAKNDISNIEYGLFSEYFQKNPEILEKSELADIVYNSQNKGYRKNLALIKEKMDKCNIFICIPLMKNRALSGIIIIGDKADRDYYNKEDFTFLETFSHQVQTAIDNTLLYREVEENNRDLKKAKIDLTEMLKNSEENRMKAETERDKTATIISSFSDGLIILDEKDDIFSVNPEAEKILGVKTDKLLGRPIRSIAGFPRADTVASVFSSGPSSISKKEVALEKDIIIEVSVIPLNLDKNDIGHLIVLHDVSREKIVEKMKTEFVSLAAHQLRTPLSIIKWSMSMLKKGDFGKLNKKQNQVSTFVKIGMMPKNKYHETSQDNFSPHDSPSHSAI